MFPEEEEPRDLFPTTTPEENAILNDWRHQAYVLTMQPRTVENNIVIMGDVYSTTIINDTKPPKGKKAKNAFVIFTLNIPTPQEKETTK